MVDFGSTAPKVLYWKKGGALSPEESLEAFNFGPGVAIRNSDHDTKDGALEAHDFVAGPDIPARYLDDRSKHKKPEAKPYGEWMKEKLEKQKASDFDKEKLDTVNVHGGPHGEDGQPVVKTMQIASGSGTNRPDLTGNAGMRGAALANNSQAPEKSADDWAKK